MKRPKFVNKYKLLQPICDVEGNDLSEVQVGSVYEVTHQEQDVLDTDGNPVMQITAIEINGFESRILSSAFDDFFEKVKDGEAL